jgi:microcystin-dependent protein
VAPGALVDGMTHLVRFNAANGVGATLNVNNLGAIPLQYYSAGAWRAVPTFLFNTDTISRVAYNASAGAYFLLDVEGDTGEVKPFAGATAPAGHLLCFGQTISRTAYAGLFAVLGTTYGAGDGSTTFNLPDLRGIVVAGKDDMGGTNANRLSSVMASTTLGAGGGQQTESAGVSVSGSLGASVSGTLNGTAHGYQGGTISDAAGSSGQSNIEADVSLAVSVSGSLGGNASGTLGGSTAAVTNVQPTLILNQMIRI